MRLFSALVLVSSSLFATSAYAQDAAPLPPLPAPSAPPAAPPPPPPAAPPPVSAAPRSAPPPVVYDATPAYADPDAPEPESPTGAPRARTGFQLALRTGWATPFGSASGAAGDDMSNTFGGQVPLFMDLGWKVSPHVFLGGYLGLGVGGTAGSTGQACSSPAVTCVSATFRVGLQVQYHFAPADEINPWIGYGIGLESSGVGASGSGPDASVAVAGPEYGHFMAGVDFRVSRGVGIGPLVDFSVGQYSRLSTKIDGVTRDNDINNTALHEWLMIGGRVVFFP